MIVSSIINNDAFAKDSNTPFTFIEWLEQNSSISSDVNVQFANYKNYVLIWSEKKSLSKSESLSTLQSLYIQVLREIAITYSTEEERRFISNADLNNASDVEIILPFFITKLKQLCLYYSIARESIKNSPIEYNIRGTSFGIKKLIKDIIFSTAQIDQFFDNRPCFFPPLSSIATDLNVEIEELYDLTDNYYNQPAKNEQNTTGLENISATNIVFPSLYLDFKQAVIDTINQYPFYIESLYGSFSINPYLSGTEINYLKARDFIDYIKSNTTDTLKINLLNKLAPKYLANDFYYLSTGSTNTEIVSGLLFSVSPLTGAPTLNLLNRQHATVASVQNLELLYADYEIGRFFLPHHQGILLFNTPAKKYEVDIDKLQPNTVYAFPDPNIIGNVMYNSNEDKTFLPISYVVDVSWNKTSRSNQYKFGDVFATSYNNQYYGYQSREDDIKLMPAGISRVQDNIDFWEGIRKNTWSNLDLWPGIDKANSYPNAARQDSLLINNNTPVYWGSDLFGNDFCLVKNIDNLKTVTIPVTSDGIMPGQSTVLKYNNIQLTQNSLFEKKSLPGELYVRNTITNKIQTGTEVLSSILLKYPQVILDDLKNGINYFAIYNNTLVIETSGYVLVDSINFNYSTHKIIPAGTQNLFYKKAFLNNKLEYFAGEWYSEKENNLYLCFLKLDINGYRTNFKALYPQIYIINLDTLNSRLIYPNSETYSQNVYSLSTINNPPQLNIVQLEGINFEYLQRSNLFNLTYLGKNLNSLPFIVNEQLTKLEPFFKTNIPQLYQPFYYVVDNNYFTQNLSLFVKYIGSKTGNIGAHLFKEGSFHGSTLNLTGVNYLFCDGVKPLQINTIGTYIAYFDWQSYNEVTMFLGCSGYTIKNTGTNLIWDAFTKNATLLTSQSPLNITQTKNNIDINIEITRFSDNQIKFVLTSNNPGFTGLLCDSPDSIYNSVTVAKQGDGDGKIITDPYCIDCNSECSELFGYNTTVTFIASADYWSNFIGWIGGPCDKTTTDCIFTVVSSVNFNAYFQKIPTRTITVTTPAGRVFSQDLRINVAANDGSQGPASTTILYPKGKFVTLSAVTPISGWAMYGYDGGGCNGIAGTRCTFIVTEDANIFARYIRSYEYPLRVFVKSFVQAQSANDSIIIGADNVDNGVPTYGDSFFYKYNCSDACTFILSGTNTARYGNQTATLCARPSPGRRLKYWIGDSDCSNEEYALKSTITPYASVVIAEPADTVNTGYICKLTMDRSREVTGIFDIGYYTLTLIISGDGVGDAFSYPEIFNNFEVPPVFYYKERVQGDVDVLKFAVLSGTTLTVRCTAVKGSTFLNLSSIYFAPVDGISARTVTLNNDVTVIATFSALEFYTLTILNKTTCGVTVTSFPLGRYGTNINCGTTSCQAIYAANRIIDIETVDASTDCDVHYFLTEAIPGGGLQFKYQPGPGINLSFMDQNAIIGDTLSLVDPSIILGSGGAPYASGDGITVEPKAYVVMTQNLTITAFPL